MLVGEGYMKPAYDWFFLHTRPRTFLAIGDDRSGNALFGVVGAEADPNRIGRRCLGDIKNQCRRTLLHRNAGAARGRRLASYRASFVKELHDKIVGSALGDEYGRQSVTAHRARAKFRKR